MKLELAVFVSSLYAASLVNADNLYVVGSVGQSEYRGSRSAADDALAGSAGLTFDNAAGVPHNFDDTDTGYKLQVGYSFTPNFAVEGGYVDLGRQNYRVDFGTAGGSAHVDDRGWNIDALGIVPLANGFSVFGKLGVIDAKTRYSLSGEDIGGSFSEGVDKDKLAPNFGIGGTYTVADATAVRLEFERFADLGRKSTTGEQNVDLLSLGVSYRFN